MIVSLISMPKRAPMEVTDLVFECQGIIIYLDYISHITIKMNDHLLVKQGSILVRSYLH
jgi:hypothetical protein